MLTQIANQPLTWPQVSESVNLLKFKPIIRMGKRGDISDFEHNMVVGVRRAGPNMKLLVYWDFHRKIINSYPGSSSCAGENAVLV